MTKKIICSLSVLFSLLLCISCVSTQKTSTTENSTKNEDVEVLEGFNTSTQWKAVGKNWGDGDCSSTVSLSTEWFTEGESSLKGSFVKTPETGGAATFFTESIPIPDFTPYETVLFDVNNPLSVPIEVSFAITTGGSWEWYESNVFSLEPGESKDLQVDLYTNSLKCSLSGWQFTANLGDSDDVRRIAVKFQLPGNTEGSVFIDNIRVK
jgi:hypothetical protein